MNSVPTREELEWVKSIDWKTGLSNLSLPKTVYLQKTPSGAEFLVFNIDGQRFRVLNGQFEPIYELGLGKRPGRPKGSRNRPKFYANGEPVNTSAWEEADAERRHRLQKKVEFQEAKDRLVKHRIAEYKSIQETGFIRCNCSLTCCLKGCTTHDGWHCKLHCVCYPFESKT